MKQNFKEMFLESVSGYMMPFALGEKEELQTALGFGEQIHPMTGKNFIHKGVDFSISDKPLYAIASGVVIGAGQDSIHDNYLVAKYGKYEVTYGHISEAYTPYGTKIKAGQEIAKCGKFLHLGVRFNGVDMDPSEFLSMIWANIEQLAAMGISQMPEIETLGDKKVTNSYEQDKDALTMMMLRWLPNYWNDLLTGAYTPPQRTDLSLRNIFGQAASKDYFFETVPSVGNPLGLSGRSSVLAGKVQDLLIKDFLCYMALNHNLYPATWDESQKKNFLGKLPLTEQQ